MTVLLSWTLDFSHFAGSKSSLETLLLAMCALPQGHPSPAGKQAGAAASRFHIHIHPQKDLQELRQRTALETTLETNAEHIWHVTQRCPEESRQRKEVDASAENCEPALWEAPSLARKPVAPAVAGTKQKHTEQTKPERKTAWMCPAILLPSLDHKELKTETQILTCECPVAQFTSSERWKQPTGS